MGDAKTYTGSCFCGAVALTVSGEPAAMGYCHCESCRTWSAGPVNAFTLWNPEHLKITRGADNIASIAAAIGYDSEASFSRAFKKMLGRPPSQWRH